ncbi:MAG: hypothetical protein ACXWHA_10935, partial [Usitatibacter sp.]
MRRAFLAALATGAVITSALGIGASTPAPHERPLARDEFKAALAQIDTARTGALARCDRETGPAREICLAEIGAGESVRIADLEASYRRTREAARNAQRARIEARYVI